MRAILDADPRAYVLALAALGGVSGALDRAVLKSSGDQLPLAVVLLGSVLGGAVVGGAMLYVFGVLVHWTGHLFRGQATLIQVRAAIAWPQVLPVWGLFLWIPQLLLFRGEVFTTETPRMDSSPPLLAVYFVLGAVEAVVAVWSIVVFVKCVAEAQQFSSWRALGNVVLATLIVLLPFVFLDAVG